MSDGHAARKVDRRVKERQENEKRKGKILYYLISLRFHYRGYFVLVLRKILA